MKKFIAVLLIVCMLLPLAACGDKNQPTTPAAPTTPTEPTTPAAPTTPTEPTTPADPAAPAEPAEPAYARDPVTGLYPNGKNHLTDEYLPLAKPGEDNHLSIGVITNANCTDYVNNEFTKWLQEKTGCELEIVQYSGSSSDVAVQISLALAANETLPDILWSFSGITKTTANEYGREGYFVNLKEYYDNPEFTRYQDDAFELQYPDGIAKEYTMRYDSDVESGGVYAMWYCAADPDDMPKSHTTINTKWLEKLGLKEPETIDELYNVLVHFRDDDPNGNGKKDEIPMLARTNANYRDIISYLINAFTFYNYSYHFTVTDDNVVSSPYHTDEYREALKFIKKLIDEQLLSPMTFTITLNELKALINPTDGVYTVGITCGHLGLDYLTAEVNDVYRPIRALKDAGTGKGGYAARNLWSITMSTFITSYCDNPELAFKFLDFCCGVEGYMHQRWGVEGEDWEWTDGTTKGTLGGTAMFRTMNPQIYQQPGNRIWYSFCTISNMGILQKEVDVNDPWMVNIYENYNKFLPMVDEVGQPKNIAAFLSYSEDETTERNDFTTDLLSYIKKARTDFATGTLDPNSDADWKTYLDDLEKLHYSRWIEIAQSAWNRDNLAH